MRQARKLREERELSLRDVEEATGIDHSSIGRFEQGGGLREENEDALARYYGVTVDELRKRVEPEGAKS